ncbi:STAS domain-containing protein [Butyrivibrio sp. YAB3001]|uniref:STAS domain-containing protein n=1 Tax=Butyrivibrio sp. YAB3001 TaxID=1520812 RepID=UPI0008F6902E|nr:STAS domain-containing protein [Butyrivibrio sp. YAB3001]SFD08963.1 anti-sigma B factor antagonist [Butyrivibrio sp. YAB3001]
MSELNIEEKKNGKELIVSLSGRIDTITSIHFSEVINEKTLQGITSLILEMKDVSYVSSAGLRVLILAQQIMDQQGTMVIKNLSPDIKEVFDDVGFSDFMTFEND